MEMILHAPSAMPESPKPCGRTIKPETEDIAAKHQGKCLISGVISVWYVLISVWCEIGRASCRERV